MPDRDPDDAPAEDPPAGDAPADDAAAGDAAAGTATGGRTTDPPVARRRPVRATAIVVIAALTALLGFAIVVQVRQNSSTDNLANLRDDELVGILDDQDARADRLRRQIASLQQDLRELTDNGDRSAAARRQAEQARTTLGILLGTVAARGPGVRVRISDPASSLDAEQLLDVVEELRGAGAEAIQFGTVRVSTDTAFTAPAGANGGAVTVDGVTLRAPYSVIAIGDPKTLDTALNIPGGVASTVRTAGGRLVVSEQRDVVVGATRALPATTYMTPAPR